MKKDLYWKNKKLDHLDEIVKYIDEEDILLKILQKMTKIQIESVFEDLEYPYSSFNIDKEYSDYFWTRYKAAVNKAYPDLLLMSRKD